MPTIVTTANRIPVLLAAVAALAAAALLLAVSSARPAAGQEPSPAVVLSKDFLLVRKGNTATYEITLATAPSASVTVTPASSDASIATVSGPVVFGPDDYGDPKSVTITAVKAGGASISHTVTSADSMYNYMGAPSLGVAVVSPPVLTNLTMSAPRVGALEATWDLPEGWNPSWDNRDGGLFPPCYVVRYREVGKEWHVSEGFDHPDKLTCKEGRSPYYAFSRLKNNTEYEVAVRTHDTDWVTAKGTTLTPTPPQQETAETETQVGGL